MEKQGSLRCLAGTPARPALGLLRITDKPVRPNELRDLRKIDDVASTCFHCSCLDRPLRSRLILSESAWPETVGCDCGLGFHAGQVVGGFVLGRRNVAYFPAVPVTHPLHEIRELGYTDLAILLVRYLNQGRAEGARPVTTPRRATWLLLTHPEHLGTNQLLS